MMSSRLVGQVTRLSTRQWCPRVQVVSPRCIATTCAVRDEQLLVKKTSVADIICSVTDNKPRLHVGEAVSGEIDVFAPKTCLEEYVVHGKHDLLELYVSGNDLEAEIEDATPAVTEMVGEVKKTKKKRRSKKDKTKSKVGESVASYLYAAPDVTPEGAAEALAESIVETADVIAKSIKQTAKTIAPESIAVLAESIKETTKTIAPESVAGTVEIISESIKETAKAIAPESIEGTAEIVAETIKETAETIAESITGSQVQPDGTAEEHDVELTAEETLEIEEEAERLECEENNVPLEAEGIDIDEMLLSDATEFDELDDADDEDYYNEDSDDDIRTQLLSVALDNVPQYGWTMQSIDKAVELLELSPACGEIFKRGPLDLVLFFIEEANNTLTEHLAEEAKRTNLAGEKECADFIERAIKTRLQMLIPYIDSWPQALKLMANPAAAQDVFENGATLMDEIFYHAGDVAVDMSWYARRGALAGIYCTTEMFMLNDKSPDFQDTWAYLHRRMNDARALNRAKDSLDNCVVDGMALFGASVTTVQNMLGVGRRDR